MRILFSLAFGNKQKTFFHTKHTGHVSWSSPFAPCYSPSIRVFVPNISPCPLLIPYSNWTVSSTPTPQMPRSAIAIQLPFLCYAEVYLARNLLPRRVSLPHIFFQYSHTLPSPCQLYNLATWQCVPEYVCATCILVSCCLFSFVPYPPGPRRVVYSIVCMPQQPFHKKLGSLQSFAKKLASCRIVNWGYFHIVKFRLLPHRKKMGYFCIVKKASAFLHRKKKASAFSHRKKLAKKC